MSEQIIISFLVVFLYESICQTYFDSKNRTLSTYFFSFYFALGIILYMLQESFAPIIISPILAIVIYLSFVLKKEGNQSEKVAISTFVSVMYLFVNNLNNTFFYNLFDLRNHDYVNLEDILGFLTSFSRIAMVAISLLSIRMISKIIKKRSITLFWMLLLITNLLASIIIVATGSLFTGQSATNLIICISLLVSIMQYASLFVVLKQIYAKQKEDQLLVIGNMIEKFMSDIEQKQRGINKLNHDFQNQILGISYLLENGEYNECKRYIEGLSQELSIIPLNFKTGHPLADMVLTVMKSKHCTVNFVIKERIPESKGISATDFTSLIYNLVENACEAAEKAENKDVFIKMSANTSHYFISIVNATSANPIETSFITNKSEPFHGIGYQIINDIVTKYHGELYPSFESDVFTFKIILMQK